MTDKRPFFFFHIPKTAGSTMQSLLVQHFTPDEIASAWTLTTLLGLDRKQLSRKRLFQGHFFGALEQLISHQSFRFTILRDPVERALSHYGHVVRDNQHYLHRRAIELGSFEAYLDDPMTGMTVINFQSRMLALDCDIEAIYRKLTDQEREGWQLERYIETTDFGLDGFILLEKAQERLVSFDVVGIAEKFEETVALLCHTLDWKFPDEIHARNVNSKRLLRTELAPSTLNHLTDLNAVDLALYELVRQAFTDNFLRMLANLITARATKSPVQRLLDLLHEKIH